MKLRLFAPLLMTASLVGAFACSGPAGPTDTVPTSAPTSQELAQNPKPVLGPKIAAPGDERPMRAKRGHRGHGPAGPLTLFDVAERELTLSDAQNKTLDETRAVLEKDFDAMRDDEQQIEKKLAVAVRAGEIDAATIKADIDTLAKKFAASAKTHAESLGKLHATLDAEQRKTLVEAVRARAGKDRRGPPPGAMAPGEGPKRRFGPFADLELTAEQKAALEKALGAKPDHEKKFAEHKQRMDAILTAFASDRFDASAQIAPEVMAKHHSERLVRELELAKAAIAVLDANQREKLAERMERGPGKHGPMRARPGGVR